MIEWFDEVSGKLLVPELELVVAINANGQDGATNETNQPLALIKRFIIPAALP